MVELKNKEQMASNGGQGLSSLSSSERPSVSGEFPSSEDLSSEDDGASADKISQDMISRNTGSIKYGWEHGSAGICCSEFKNSLLGPSVVAFLLLLSCLDVFTIKFLPAAWKTFANWTSNVTLAHTGEYSNVLLATIVGIVLGVAIFGSAIIPVVIRKDLDRTEKIKNSTFRMACIGGFVISCFLVINVLVYETADNYDLGILGEPMDIEELKTTALYMSDLIEENELNTDFFKYSPMDFKDEIGAAVSDFVKEYHQVPVGVYPTPVWDRTILVGGATGITQPLIGRTRISDTSDNLTGFGLLAHEYAHMYTHDEKEAEYISVMSLLGSENVVLQQAGMLSAFNRLWSSYRAFEGEDAVREALGDHRARCMECLSFLLLLTDKETKAANELRLHFTGSEGLYESKVTDYYNGVSDEIVKRIVESQDKLEAKSPEYLDSAFYMTKDRLERYYVKGWFPRKETVS